MLGWEEQRLEMCMFKSIPHVVSCRCWWQITQRNTLPPSRAGMLHQPSQLVIPSIVVNAFNKLLTNHLSSQWHWITYTLNSYLHALAKCWHSFQFLVDITPVCLIRRFRPSHMSWSATTWLVHKHNPAYIVYTSVASIVTWSKQHASSFLSIFVL